MRVVGAHIAVDRKRRGRKVALHVEIAASARRCVVGGWPATRWQVDVQAVGVCAGIQAQPRLRGRIPEPCQPLLPAALPVGVQAAGARGAQRRACVRPRRAGPAASAPAARRRSAAQRACRRRTAAAWRRRPRASCPAPRPSTRALIESKSGQHHVDVAAIHRRLECIAGGRARRSAGSATSLPLVWKERISHWPRCFACAGGIAGHVCREGEALLQRAGHS